MGGALYLKPHPSQNPFDFSSNWVSDPQPLLGHLGGGGIGEGGIKREGGRRTKIGYVLVPVYLMPAHLIPRACTSMPVHLIWDSDDVPPLLGRRLSVQPFRGLKVVFEERVAGQVGAASDPKTCSMTGQFTTIGMTSS